VQEETNRSVQAIAGIGEIIGQVRHISSAIASAVEEQGAATREIARNVEQAAQGTQEVSGNIGSVTRTAAETGVAAGKVSESVQGLARHSVALRGAVSDFLAGVRAG